MFSLVRLGALAVILAAVVIGALWLSGVVAADRAAELGLRTSGILALFFVAAMAWRSLRGKAHVRDKTDQPVP